MSPRQGLRRHACVRCPACGQPIGEERHGVRLPARKAAIFDAIARTGENGITFKNLFNAIYPDEVRTYAVLRTHIWQINERLEAGDVNMRIVNISRWWFVREIKRRPSHGRSP